MMQWHNHQLVEKIRAAGADGIPTTELLREIYRGAEWPLFARKCLHVRIHRINQFLRYMGEAVRGSKGGIQGDGRYRVVKLGEE